MKQLFIKYKDMISYLFFGVLTTAVNVAAYYLSYDVAHLPNVAATVIAWALAVAFAFVTNKLFVFDSKSWAPSVALGELASFTLCRVGTGVIEVGMMYLFVDLLSFNGTVMKLFTNVIVIVLNFIFSKLIIFKKK